MTPSVDDERQKHVYPQMIDRWAKRYLELWRKNGEHAVGAWMRSFLHEDDQVKVVRRAREMAKQKK